MPALCFRGPWLSEYACWLSRIEHGCWLRNGLSWLGCRKWLPGLPDVHGAGGRCSHLDCVGVVHAHAPAAERSLN
jgi:hypothetical protein